MVRFLLMIGAAISLNAAHAAPPSKTDVIQCGIDAGERRGDERRAFVEGCVSFKSAVREAGGEVKQKPGEAFDCRAQAQAKEAANRRSFLEGCKKAKKDNDASSKPSASVK